MQFSRKLSLLAAGLACAFAAHAQVVKETPNSQFKPTGKGWGELDNVATAASNGKAGGASNASSLTNLSYHNGPVMTAPKNLYYIWYGTQWDTASQNVLNNLGQHLGGSPYFNINTTYYNASKAYVQNSLTLAGSTSNTGTYGSQLSDANIASIVSDAITTGKLPADANGIYVVLTDHSTSETSGFCTQYCGWHNHTTISGMDIKYAFVGNAETQCASACGATSPSPNNTPGADAAASVLSHEVEESTTDPDLNAWYSNYDGEENGDKCAWNFGTTSTASNGAKYNQTFGTMKYLIQQNWVIAATQQCLQHYP
ncbi:MAG TPA: hypothetical protein VF793_03085 [Telluria sp.]|jgi:hypothetical protein